MLLIECNPRTCRFGKFCENTQIQKKAIASVKIFKTDKKGYGIKAKEFIQKGTYIAEYVGKVRKETDFLELMNTIYSNENHHYCMRFEKGLVIDAYRLGNIIRFVNHSCEPNCQIQKWTVNGVSRLALYAIEDIEKHDELTYDYKFVRFNSNNAQTCYCGSANCRGIIWEKMQKWCQKDIRFHVKYQIWCVFFEFRISWDERARSKHK